MHFLLSTLYWKGGRLSKDRIQWHTHLSRPTILWCLFRTNELHIPSLSKPKTAHLSAFKKNYLEKKSGFKICYFTKWFPSDWSFKKGIIYLKVITFYRIYLTKSAETCHCDHLPWYSHFIVDSLQVSKLCMSWAFIMLSLQFVSFTATVGDRENLGHCRRPQHFLRQRHIFRRATGSLQTAFFLPGPL